MEEMVKIPFKGKEVEIEKILDFAEEFLREEKAEEYDPSGRGNYYVVGEWHRNEEEYQKAVLSAQAALETLAELAQEQKSLPEKELREKLAPFTRFNAKYSYSAEARGMGEGHADQRLDDAEKTYNLGKMVRYVAKQLLHKFRTTYYVVFGDELAGGYGYWLGNESLEESLIGEKHLTCVKSGSFPTEQKDLALRILEEACKRRLEMGFYEKLGELDRL